MSALSRLSDGLRGSEAVAERSLPASESIGAVIVKLEKQVRGSADPTIPDEVQQKALERFWDCMRFDNLRDAKLVSFGLCVAVRSSNSSVMEDRQRFRAVLDQKAGVDQWLDDPRWYRRCYQGLVRSFFAYDVDGASSVGRQNWGVLRDYLGDRIDHIHDPKVNPTWVEAAIRNEQLFGPDPCDSYAEAMLKDDSSEIDRLCEQLGITKASWFLRELELAQVRHVTGLDDDGFKNLIPHILQRLAENEVVRDRGLILLLDRFVKASHAGMHQQLRDAAVNWWGNPWLPSNETRWGGVSQAARELIADWLKREFIEAFFAKLAKDGVGDRRRANFWLRYAKSMDNIQFALGSTALYSRDKDFVVLRQKMKGLITELRTTESSNNAFVMTLGNLVAVEFGSMGNAFYGYDTKVALPFDLSRPVVTGKDMKNSLKSGRNILWMLHKDGIHGWKTWEQMFEATLRKEFGILPNVTTSRETQFHELRPDHVPPPARHEPPRQQTAGTILPFNRKTLMAFANARGIKVDDLTDRNGNLWVRTGNGVEQVSKVLLDWGFKYRPDKGWWK